MFYVLTEALKNRFILELRRFFSYHPKYRSIVDSIQGKFSFEERPQMGIIVKMGSANSVSLSADNYHGVQNSYCYLSKVKVVDDNGSLIEFPGVSVEWVREDARAIQDNDGIMPSPAGIYYCEVANGGTQFYVDPLIEVRNEPATKVSSTEFTTLHAFLEGSLAVYQMPGNFRLYENVNFTSTPSTGEIVLTNPLTNTEWLSVDYRYPGEGTGPWDIEENFANNRAIPGVSIAFGHRVEDGDRFAIVIQPYRAPAALEYGGRWDINLDFDVTAVDVFAQQEITDAAIMYLWAILRSRLASEGIEILSVSMGGESEELRGETADEYFFNSSFSIQCQTDWMIWVPLMATVRAASPQSLEDAKETAGMTENELLEAHGNNIVVIENMAVDLRSFQDPWFVGRNRNFEKIS